MIRSRNFWLILDTNVLADVLSGPSVDDLVSRIKAWLCESIESGSSHVDNKRIILPVSTRMLCDYKTGLAKRGFKRNLVHGMELLLEHSALKIPIDTSYGTFFLIPILIPESQLKYRVITRDKYDSKLCTLAKSVFLSKKYGEFGLVLACSDKTTSKELEDEIGHSASKSGRPFLVAKSVRELEIAISNH